MYAALALNELTPALISNHLPSKVWYEFTDTFPNFNGSTAEVWETIINFTLHFTMKVIAYPFWKYS